MNFENWESIAKELGGIDEHGQESSSSDKAREAIEVLIGRDFMRNAVRYYVSNGNGSELLRGVLWQLHPYSAMEECYKLFKTGDDIQTKRDAVELLRVIADHRAIKWIPEFLAHEDQDVQQWGIGVVDQLVYSDLCEYEDVLNILKAAQSHQNEGVREKTEYILSMITASEERDAFLQAHFESKNT